MGNEVPVYDQNEPHRITPPQAQNTESVPAGASYFDGGALALFGINLLIGIVAALTVGIATPWMICWKQRYICEHTVISGRRLMFLGTGGSLFVNMLKWFFLTLITLGIYGLWLYVKERKWFCANTTFEDGSAYSTFDGSMAGSFGHSLVMFLVTVITLFIGFPWMLCYFMRWDTRHRIVSGYRLSFFGGGWSLLGHSLLWLLLSVITFGIFDIWIEKKSYAWYTERTEIAEFVS